MVEPTVKADYKSPHVEERFHKKPIPKFIIGEILRIEHVVKNHEQYYDTIGVVAGWARTLRFDMKILLSLYCIESLEVTPLFSLNSTMVPLWIHFRYNNT